MAAGPSCFILLLCLCTVTSCLLFILPVSADDLGLFDSACLRNASASEPGSASNTRSSRFDRNLNWALGNITNLASDGTTYAIAVANAESLCFSTSQNLAAYGSDCNSKTISASTVVDTAYAMFQCRGDQTVQGCATCVDNATATLSESLCPFSIGARIQLDGCYVRFDNRTFFTLDTDPTKLTCYGKTDDTVALSAIDSLVSNVTTQAPKDNGYASKSASSEYALAQCLGYLDEDDCLDCLTSYSYRLACDSALGVQIHLGSCYYRFEPYSFFAVPAPPPTIEAPPPSPTQGSNVGAIAGGVVAGALAMGVLFITLVWCRRRRSKKRRRVQEEHGSSQPLFKPKGQIFSLQDLEVATEHFHPHNKLGEGGFGPVHKGVLPNGQQIAVKKLSVGSQQGKREFMNEVSLITTVQHKNLIRLLGSCVEGPERILVYEYLPNGSVEELLFDVRIEATTLDWPTREGIILGMARGLAYLHEESQVRIIHRDIKPSNILLGDHLNPVIGDFGLARLVSDDETHINTRVAGTIGYVAPEYIVNGELTEKVDVFSFGVVTLEIITGLKNSRDNVVEQIWLLYQNRRELELVDPKLGTTFSTEQVIRAIHVALLCVQEAPSLRPKMSSVTLLLSGNSNIVDVPTKPAFVGMTRALVGVARGRMESTSSAFSSWSSTSLSSSKPQSHNFKDHVPV